MTNSKYSFTSKRLGFRNWVETDSDKMIAISANTNVMRFFPAPATPQQTKDFIARMQDLFHEKKYCYFAVDLLETGEFIGFVGLNDFNYKASFSPGTDIGWRLAEIHWGNGYATEGARRCLEYAFQDLKLGNIVATAPLINKPSISVMKKIGMDFKTNFKHPRLKEFARIENCVCYEIKKN
ncbi:MAG: GNAT family N-acetyltransferase [Crocinitomicaceae bacterium]